MLAKLVSPVKYRTGPYLQLAANMVPGQARPQAADLLVSPDLSVLSPLSRQLDRPTLIGSGPISPLTTDCWGCSTAGTAVVSHAVFPGCCLPTLSALWRLMVAHGRFYSHGGCMVYQFLLLKLWICVGYMHVRVMCMLGICAKMREYLGHWLRFCPPLVCEYTAVFLNELLHHRHVILHVLAKFHSDQTIECRGMTSYRFFKMAPMESQISFEFQVWWNLGSLKSVSRSNWNFDEVSRSTAKILLLTFSENKRLASIYVAITPNSSYPK